jgi:hypothetical protein
VHVALRRRTIRVPGQLLDSTALTSSAIDNSQLDHVLSAQRLEPLAIMLSFSGCCRGAWETPSAARAQRVLQIIGESFRS